MNILTYIGLTVIGLIALITLFVLICLGIDWVWRQIDAWRERAAMRARNRQRQYDLLTYRRRHS